MHSLTPPIHEREHFFRTLLDSAPDAVLLTDAGGVILLANRRCLEMFGYGDDQLQGMEVEVLIPKRARAAHRKQRAGFADTRSRRKMGERHRIVGLRSDGTGFHADVSLGTVVASAMTSSTGTTWSAPWRVRRASSRPVCAGSAPPEAACGRGCVDYATLARRPTAASAGFERLVRSQRRAGHAAPRPARGVP